MPNRTQPQQQNQQGKHINPGQWPSQRQDDEKANQSGSQSKQKSFDSGMNRTNQYDLSKEDLRDSIKSEQQHKSPSGRA